MFWGYPPPPHDYPFYWVILDPKSKQDKVKFTNLKNSPKFQFFVITFWSCSIRCANMKWIWWVLLKIQSRHDSVHRRTGWNQYTPINFVEGGGERERQGGISLNYNAIVDSEMGCRARNGNQLANCVGAYQSLVLDEWPAFNQLSPPDCPGWTFLEQLCVEC